MPSSYEVVGLIAAGMGLFFIGVRMIGINLRMMASLSIRSFLSKVTERGWISGLVGILAGGITQSTSAVTFIMAGLISAGVIAIRRAMPLVLWSNVGNCILVFLAVINFHIMILYLLGIIGFLYYCFDLDRLKITKPFVGVILGAGLLFLGLDFMKSGASHLREYEWIADFIIVVKESHMLGLLTAAFIAFFIQSAATVSAIAIALANTGILDLQSTLMIIYGTNLGPGLSTWVFASKLTGPPKRLAMFQVIFKFIGLFILVPLFYIEIATGLPLVAALLTKITSNLNYQLAFGYLLFQLVGAVILTFLMDPLNKFLIKFYPETKKEQLSKPFFMYDEALKDPDVAIALLEREQKRVIKRLPAYFSEVRAEAPKIENPWILHSATVVLCQDLEQYFEDLLEKSMSQFLVEKALNLQNRMEIIIEIEESLYEMISAVHDRELSSAMEHFKYSVIEATDLLLLALIDALKFTGTYEREVIVQLTEDRGDLMRKIHSEVRKKHPNLNVKEQQIFDILSSRFERIIWMTRYLNKLLEDFSKKR